jgi:hypothetical protein
MINIKLGTIYYVDDLKLHNKLSYIEYIKISSVSEIKLSNKPILIIGWELAKEKYKTTNILNKNINNLYFWTFNFSEKKTDYIFDLNKFIKYDILNVFNSYKFINLSPIFNKDLNSIDNYISFFNDCELNSIYISKNLQLTILCNDELFRINLKELNYYNIDIKILLNYLKFKYKNFIYDKNGNIELEYTEYFKILDNNIIKKYIPLFNKVNSNY